MIALLASIALLEAVLVAATLRPFGLSERSSRCRPPRSPSGPDRSRRCYGAGSRPNALWLSVTIAG